MHIPKRAYQSSAGYHLHAAETKVVKPWARVLIRLDLLIAISESYYRQIVGCSDLENMRGIIVHDGTIDSDYQQTICVVFFNLSNEEYLVEAGNHITQLIIEHLWRRK